MSNIITAASAYQNQLKLMQGVTSSPAQDESSGPDFSQMVKSAIKDAVNTQSTAENMQMQSLTTGKVEISDLATAVANAELSLNTIVAVRDKVISAYQSIIQMSI